MQATMILGTQNGTLSADNVKVASAYVETSLTASQPERKFPIERCGYFVADRVDHLAGVRPVFNWVVRLKDSWAR